MWIARDKDDSLCIFQYYPERDGKDYMWVGVEYLSIDNSLFPEVTWENSPVEVEIEIKRNNMTEEQIKNYVINEKFMRTFNRGTSIISNGCNYLTGHCIEDDLTKKYSEISNNLEEKIRCAVSCARQQLEQILGEI